MNKNSAFFVKAEQKSEQFEQIKAIIDRLSQNLQEHVEPALAAQTVLEAVAGALQAEAGTFWFYRRFEDGRISPMAVCGGGRLEGIYLLPGEGIAGQVVNSGEPLVISDCRQDDRWTGKVDTETGYITRTVLCVPLKTEGMAFGALQLINKAGGKPFDGQDLAFVEELARQISLIV